MASLADQYAAVVEYVREAVVTAWAIPCVFTEPVLPIAGEYALVRLAETPKPEYDSPTLDRVTFAFVIGGTFDMDGVTDMDLAQMTKADALREELMTTLSDVGGYGYLPVVTDMLLLDDGRPNFYQCGLTYQVTCSVDR